MLAHESIPPKLNGYTVVATCPVLRDPDIAVVLVHDPSRRLPAYATALVSKSSLENLPPEWFWGHYFDGEDKLEEAMRDFFERAGVTHGV